MEMPQRPDVLTMFTQLEAAYQQLANHCQAQSLDKERLRTVLADLHWYGSRLGEARWEKAPRPGRWSFADNLWHITSQALQQEDQPDATSLVYFIDHGKEHVGQAAEIFALFKYS
jgi:hypothetical protein